jgi:ribosome maturation factor RimP
VWKSAEGTKTIKGKMISVDGETITIDIGGEKKLVSNISVKRIKSG